MGKQTEYTTAVNNYMHTLIQSHKYLHTEKHKFDINMINRTKLVIRTKTFIRSQIMHSPCMHDIKT